MNANPKELSVIDQRTAEFRDMMDRLKMLISNGRKFSDIEAQALATFAVAEKLDPFSGECYLLKNEKTGEIIGPMVGVKGLRRKGQEKLGEVDSFFIDFNEIDPPTPDIMYAFTATLRDTKTMKQYLAMRVQAERMFRESGSKTPSDDAFKLVGGAPVWAASGYFYKSEVNDFKDKKFHPREKAQKRAEAAVIKKRFSLNYNYGDNGAGTSLIEAGEVIDVDFQPDPQTVHPTIEPESAAQPIDEAPFVTPPELKGEDDSRKPQGERSEQTSPETQAPPATNGAKRPYSPEVLKEKLAVMAQKHEKQRVKPSEMTRKMIAPNLEMCFAGEENSDKIRHSVQKWLFGVDSVKDLSDAQVLAARDWLDAKPDDGGLWKPNPMAVTEAQAVWHQALKDAGQLEMGI